MPEPGGFIKPAPIVKLYKSPKMKNTSTLNKFKALEIKGLEENLTCIECEEFLLHSEHFVYVYFNYFLVILRFQRASIFF